METALEVAYRFVCCSCGNLVADYSTTCPYCFRSGMLVPRHRRPMDEYRPAGRVMTARELLQQSVKHVVPRAYQNLKLGRPCLVLVAGPAGSGKTRFLLKLADSLSPAVYLPLEMGCSALMADYIRSLELSGENLRFVEVDSQADLAGWAAGAGTFVVDSFSVSTMTPEDAERITRGHNLICAGALHVTKQNLLAGQNSWSHAADVIVEVEAGRWRLTKSRYQELGIGGDV